VHADRNSSAAYKIVVRNSHAELPEFRYLTDYTFFFFFAGIARNNTTIILDNKSKPNKPILVTVRFKGTAKLAAKPTQHNTSGKTPHKEVKINIIACGSGYSVPDPTGVLSSNNSRLYGPIK
jgi:hypothetical protein